MATPLDKFILRRSTASLKQIRQWILSGKVQVNQSIITDVGFVVGDFCAVHCNGLVIQQRDAHYIMLHKPIGVVSTTIDYQHQTVIDCIHEPFANELHIAGRLDLNTTGLTILTNDGKWSKKLTQPSEKIGKLYLVTTEDPVDVRYVEAFAQGMHFAYEDIDIQPAKLEITGSHTSLLTIYEGRYHQIKRMFGRFQNKVVALHRLQMGQIVLDEQLKEGEYRALSAAEIDWLNA